MVGSGDAEVEHGLGVGFFPPATGEFEALLDDVAVSAFNFTGADGQLPGSGRGVIQLRSPRLQILIGGTDGLVGGAGIFLVRAQGPQNARHFVLQESVLLAMQPRFGMLGFDDLGGGGQVLADVEKSSR